MMMFECAEKMFEFATMINAELGILTQPYYSIRDSSLYKLYHQWDNVLKARKYFFHSVIYEQSSIASFQILPPRVAAIH